MAPFYRWSSTASRLEPLWGGSLLFTFSLSLCLSLSLFLYIYIFYYIFIFTGKACVTQNDHYWTLSLEKFTWNLRWHLGRKPKQTFAQICNIYIIYLVCFYTTWKRKLPCHFIICDVDDPKSFLRRMEFIYLFNGETWKQ